MPVIASFKSSAAATETDRTPATKNKRKIFFIVSPFPADNKEWSFFKIAKSLPLRAGSKQNALLPLSPARVPAASRKSVLPIIFSFFLPRKNFFWHAYLSSEALESQEKNILPSKKTHPLCWQYIP
jgi:hypothetical protein